MKTPILNLNAVSTLVWVSSALFCNLASANLDLAPRAGLVDYCGHFDKQGPWTKLTDEELAKCQAINYSDAPSTPSNMNANLGFASGNEHFTAKYISPSNLACSTAQMTRARPHLSQIKDIRDDLHCKVKSYCQVKMILDQVSNESGLPKKVIYAVAYTESEWSHWDANGYCKTNPTNDWGLMQVNAQFRNQTNWAKVVEDPLYNARFATEVILKWSWDYVRSTRPYYAGEDLYRSVYAVYNGGPDARDRPFRYSHPNDVRFASIYEGHPWRDLIGNCSP